MHPFVKWAGGKTQLLDKLVSLMPKEYNHYFEPFIGGGALLFHVAPKDFTINDFNSELVQAYKCFSNPDDTEKLIERLKFHQENHSEEHYYEVRSMDKDPNFLSLPIYERAARMIYLNKSDVEKMFGLDLSGISNQDKTEKRFDFVFKGPLGDIYACECNFYSGGGSKLNETARSYKTLTLEAKGISGFTFVWFTDGMGWNSARHNLEETFDVLDTLYNIKDLEDGVIEKLLDAKHVIDDFLVKND